LIRLGAVSYLNTRPLVHGLEHHADRFDLRFDVPSKCAELLHANAVDLGLIPSIEYPGHDYEIVPDISIASDGPVASVAIFTKVATEQIRSIAVDTGSRTSVALLRILCAHWFDIAPRLVSMAPDLGTMLAQCDAALVIGDNALFLDAERLAVEKIDLGEEWLGMTGLPFVYAFWAGRPRVVDRADIQLLERARDRGIAATATIGRQAFPDDVAKAARADEYLRQNVKYGLGDREVEGLRRFYELAAQEGIVARADDPIFYGD
jgi:chorismate dehydratase